MEKCPLDNRADQTYQAIRNNIEAVAKLEENFAKNRSMADILADDTEASAGVDFVFNSRRYVPDSVARFRRRNAGKQRNDDRKSSCQAQGSHVVPFSVSKVFGEGEAALAGNGERSRLGGNEATRAAKSAISASALPTASTEAQTVAIRSRGTRARK